GGSYAFRVDNDTATGPRSAFNLTYYKDGNLGINMNPRTKPSSAYIVDANGSVNIRGDLNTTTHLRATAALTVTGIPGSVSENSLLGGASTQFKMFAKEGAFSINAGYSAAMLLISGATWNESTSGTHPLIATAAILKPRVVSGAATVGDTAALYIEDENGTNVSGGNYAVWVDNNTSRFDGNVLIGSNLATPIGVLDVNAPEGAGGAGTRFLVAFDGNVGVGTTTPSKRLDVNAVMKLRPTDSPGQCAATDKGRIYYDASVAELCSCNGTNWVKGSDNSTICT
ncbi:MAG: hypothetical protein UX30_C0010G0001, partial [Candidatus Saccharibacteria bacterium GW2011_GWA2_46_10]